MSRYKADGSNAVEPIELAVGDRVRLDWEADRWWTVQAVSEHYAACVRPPTEDERKAYRDEYGEDPDGPTYTVLDWRSGVRGPCDLIGQAWGDGTYSSEQCTRMLTAFEVTDDDIRAALAKPLDSVVIPFPVRVSQRNWVPLKIVGHQTAVCP